MGSPCLVVTTLPVINQIPLIRFLGDSDWMRILSEVLIFAVGALGLHILSGLTGQVSLGHAFFMGVGAYTAAVLGGEVGAAHAREYGPARIRVHDEEGLFRGLGAELDLPPGLYRIGLAYTPEDERDA